MALARNLLSVIGRFAPRVIRLIAGDGIGGSLRLAAPAPVRVEAVSRTLAGRRRETSGRHGVHGEGCAR